METGNGIWKLETGNWKVESGMAPIGHRSIELHISAQLAALLALITSAYFTTTVEFLAPFRIQPYIVRYDYIRDP